MGQGVYVVPAANGKEFTVKKGAPCSQCRETCDMCGACPHAYICECTDSRRNVCKHVHAVAMFQTVKKNEEVPVTVVQELEIDMDNLCEASDTASDEAPDPLEIAQQELTDLLSELTAEAAACQSLNAVKAATTEALRLKAILSANKQSREQLSTPAPSTCREPANKNAEKHFSRKRPKPSTPKDFARPSKEARTIFADVLLDDPDRAMPLVILRN